MSLDQHPAGQLTYTTTTARYHQPKRGKVGARMLLPVEIDISERSRKFYDGTYKITSDGFIDEAGGKHRA